MRIPPIFLLTLAFLSITACSSEKSNSGNCNSTDSCDTFPPGNLFHADNDIAMTLLSVTDALRVGETLDSTDYNYIGILTDGQGHPLYTGFDGLPGTWTVRVTGPSSLSITNDSPGDLNSADLMAYLRQTLENNAIIPMEMITASQGDSIKKWRANEVTVSFHPTYEKYENNIEADSVTITVNISDSIP